MSIYTFYDNYIITKCKIINSNYFYLYILILKYNFEMSIKRDYFHLYTFKYHERDVPLSSTCPFNYLRTERKNGSRTEMASFDRITPLLTVGQYRLR